MALLHFPILNSSVDQECEIITFKVTSQRKNAFCHNIFLLLGYSVGSIYYLQHMYDQLAKFCKRIKSLIIVILVFKGLSQHWCCHGYTTRFISTKC